MSIGAFRQTRAQEGSKDKQGSIHIDTKFLASSHFRIAQDDKEKEMTGQSIFKIDYPPKHVDRTQIARPPSPAWIHTKDDRYFNEVESETTKEYKDLKAPPVSMASNEEANRKTNIKMEKDTTKFNSFVTNHKQDFQPYPVSAVTMHGPGWDPRESHLPDGDRAKAALPLSDYRDRFREHDLGNLKHSEKGKDAYGATKPPITGDARQHHYVPTQRDHFRAGTLPRVKPIPPSADDHIPNGDPAKAGLPITEQQYSFPVHPLPEVADTKELASRLHRTNVQFGDTLDNMYNTTKKKKVPTATLR